jgi:hypothetical protein
MDAQSQILFMTKDVSSVAMPSAGMGFAGRDGGYAVAEEMAYSNDMDMAQKSFAPGESYPMPPVSPDVPPVVTGGERMVIRDSSLSVLVEHVSQSINQVQNLAESAGGYLVTSYMDTPEGASNGSITIRVPAESVDSTLEAIRNLGVRVVNESVTGQDITDQYQDLEERLRLLEQTKAKFQAIFNQASEVQDLLSVQNQLLSIQSQIDSIKGQQKYLEQNAALSRISVYFSTDELALDYTPEDVWRPQVVFKLAVRSLISTVRGGIDNIIWLAVYAVVWVPALLIAWFVYKRVNQKKK